MSDGTPTLPEFIKQTINARVAELHTSMPGIVVSYDRAKRKADVQPCLQRKFADGAKENLPILRNVPVIFPQSKKCSIVWDLEKDDHVLLVFNERSIDNFVTRGGIVDPDDTRKHSLSDAVAYPGFWPDGNAVESLAGSLEIKNELAMFRQHDGKTYVGRAGETPAEPVLLGETVKEYLTGIHEKLAAVLDILIAGDHVLTTGAGSPTAPNPAKATELTQLKADFEQLKADNLDNGAVLSDLFFTEKGS